jgi:hypothetical protein
VSGFPEASKPNALSLPLPPSPFVPVPPSGGAMTMTCPASPPEPRANVPPEHLASTSSCSTRQLAAEYEPFSQRSTGPQPAQLSNAPAASLPVSMHVDCIAMQCDRQLSPPQSGVLAQTVSQEPCSAADP